MDGRAIPPRNRCDSGFHSVRAPPAELGKHFPYPLCLWLPRGKLFQLLLVLGISLHIAFLMGQFCSLLQFQLYIIFCYGSVDIYASHTRFTSLHSSMSIEDIWPLGANFSYISSNLQDGDN